jgi:N-acetylated-alpha-linked acidic dipeptidase
LPLLKALNGHGPKASDLNKYWQGGGLSHEGIEYNIGPSPDGLLLNLVNEQEYVTTPMWNVIGIINGSISNEVVIMGNHRDAWIAGGAADPNSGSAALNEVVRSFGKALDAGWKPLRTVVFASWDGEEYGLIGSTEWVEEFLPWLSGSAVAYLNVDVGTAGSHFSASASPLLNKIIYNATSVVPSPNQTIKGQSVRDTWDGKITTMGSGSDFTAFQDFAGIPSMDLSFHPGRGDAIYHYHSNYDSFYWMDHFGDPGWHYHATMARVWAMTALTLLENPILGFNTTDYAHDFEGYVGSIQTRLDEETLGNSDGLDELRFPLEQLQLRVRKLQAGASDFDARAESLAQRLGEDIPWWKWWKKVQLFIDVRKVNTGYKLFERAFLYPKGLDGRSWFKHTVFAPGLWTGYSGATLPGLVESVDAKDWGNAKVS